MDRGAAGFSLPELLVVLVLVGIVAASIGSVFASQSRAYRREDQNAALDENLRVATGTITDVLRNAGCGTPPHSLSVWMPWVSGFTDDPVAAIDGGDNPDRLSVAACTPTLAKVGSHAAAGATTLTLVSMFSDTAVDDLFNDADKSLIWIDHRQHAQVTAVSGDTITIDTDPTTPGSQGLWSAQLVGTPITRVDVFSFSVATDSDTGRSRLELDKHRGEPTAVADSISDLEVTTITPRQLYRVTLTGRSEGTDSRTGQAFERTADIEIALRN
jgi:prepilin-type N-terminal cleavage/methylation domain-containing protein